MKIINNIFSKYQGLNKNNNIEIGNVLNFKIKEKLSDNSAIITINGKDIKARFNNGLAGVDDSKGKIQITNINSDNISVDFVEGNKVENDTEALEKLDGTDKEELQIIVKTLREKGIILTKKDIREISEFINKDNSLMEEKIDIITRLIKKDIDITFKNLISVKEALYGEGIDVNLNNLLHGLNNLIDTNMVDIDEHIIDLELNIETNQNVSNKIYERLNKENTLNEKDLNMDTEVKERDTSHLDMVLKDFLTMDASGQKKLIMTAVTEKMKVINDNFKELKNNLVRNMDSIIYDNTMGKEDIKESLESSIDLLNRKLLKSDITLYTDMLTEKKLIKISSKIDRAKNLVSQNNIDEVKTLIEEIKVDLNKLEFKASEEKIVYGISQDINETISGDKNINSIFDFLKNPPSGSREVYDYIKELGLNYENDILKEELFNLNNNDLENNLKSNLLKIITQENKGIKDISSIIKVLDSLNGQQLLNKVESNNPVQTMFFDIPINLVGKVENIKLFINSNKENEKLDWQNSSLYFLIETDKLGETGILINSKNKNLDITIRNDNRYIKDKLSPIEDRFIERIEEIGYNVGKIKYDKLSKDEIEINKVNNKPTVMENDINSSRKGLDIRI